MKQLSRIKRCVKFFLFFLIKATSKLALKTTLWSNPHHSCKEFLLVRFKVLFFFSLCSSNVHAFVLARLFVCSQKCVHAQWPGETSSVWKVRNKKINSYLQTPVLVRTPWKGVCVSVCVCAMRKEANDTARSCRATESESPANESEC